jgi:hypothetical protein
MSKQLMKIVLPRLAKRLYSQLQRYRKGQMNDEQFAEGFATLLQKQYVWLAKRGVDETEAAMTIHGAVLILSKPGLRAAAAELGQPFELVERQAVKAAATDLSENYGVEAGWAYNGISKVVAQFGE